MRRAMTVFSFLTAGSAGFRLPAREMQDHPHWHQARKHPAESRRGVCSEIGGRHEAVAAASLLRLRRRHRSVMLGEQWRARLGVTTEERGGRTDVSFIQTRDDVCCCCCYSHILCISFPADVFASRQWTDAPETNGWGAWNLVLRLRNLSWHHCDLCVSAVIPWRVYPASWGSWAGFSTLSGSG